MAVKLAFKYSLALILTVNNLLVWQNKIIAQTRIDSSHIFKNLRDSLDNLKLSQADYGFNNGVNLHGSETYDLYKDKVRIYHGYQILKLKAKNSYVEVILNTTRDVGRILYYSLKRTKPEGKTFYVNKNFQTQLYKLQIGDPLFKCIQKLKKVNYKTEYTSKDGTYISVSGVLTSWIDLNNKYHYDEYHCVYYFFKERLDLIEMTLKKDIKHMTTLLPPDL